MTQTALIRLFRQREQYNKTEQGDEVTKAYYTGRADAYKTCADMLRDIGPIEQEEEPQDEQQVS